MNAFVFAAAAGNYTLGTCVGKGRQQATEMQQISPAIRSTNKRITKCNMYN